MTSFGMIEIFYGQPWTNAQRLETAAFIKQIGFDFYLYGPKADEAFRKNWHRLLTPQEMADFRKLQENCKRLGIEFGVILSPHGLNKGMLKSQQEQLKAKISQLNDLELDYFGLFFDDMVSAPDLAARQMEVASLVQAQIRSQLIFCPSFYSNDPMLDMLFGQRPENYLLEIGKSLPADVEILWTGEQIISQEISKDHLKQVGEWLKRKPFVCDNYYADDGPLNCSFLRLLAPIGRTHEALEQASHWSINPMNQCQLSKIVFLAVANFARKNMNPHHAFEAAVHALTDSETADFLLNAAEKFSVKGLDSMPEGERQKLRDQLQMNSNPYTGEIIQWLEGYYSIDFVAMVEQSCYMGPAFGEGA